MKKLLKWTIGASLLLASVHGAPAESGGMVVAGHPLAADAGAAVLAEGGNAMDAAVAASFMLAVVEPHACGLGGGGFLLFHDANKNSRSGYDFREKSPAATTVEDYTEDGKLSEKKTQAGGLGVGVPGYLAGILQAHKEHGTMPIDRLLGPAIKAARDGFEVYPLLASHWEDAADKLMQSPASAEVFLVDGLMAHEAGSNFKQPDLAATLSRIPSEGVAVIYSEADAERVAKAVRDGGGKMTAADVTSYKARALALKSITYRGYEIVAPAMPSAGGIKVLAAMKLLEGQPVGAAIKSPDAYYPLISIALMKATEAGDAAAADPSFTSDKTQELLEADWQSQASKAFSSLSAMPQGAGPAEKDTGKTTHISVIDGQGNMVSLTQTINLYFGSGVTVPGMGILLNNQLADFTFTAGHPNRPEGGKVPRSNMSPLLIYKEGKPAAALGSPGGDRIPSALVQILLQKIDGGTTLQKAIDAPRLHVNPTRRTFQYEKSIPHSAAEAAASAVAAASGQEYKTTSRKDLDNYFGGAHGIWITRGADDSAKLEGAADPRRFGKVAVP